jgi:hypothetical protein
MINNMNNKSTTTMQIIIAGFLSFLGTLSTAQAITYILWLVGDLDPTYQLVTGVISGFIGLFVGGWITARVMNTRDVWISAVNGLLVGGASSYFLLGLNPLVLAVTVLSFVCAGMGGYAALRRTDEQPAESELQE